MCTKLDHISKWGVLAHTNRSKWVQSSSLVILWIIRTIYQVRMAWIIQIQNLSSCVCVAKFEIFKSRPLQDARLVLKCPSSNSRTSTSLGLCWCPSFSWENLHSNLFYMCVWHFCKFGQSQSCPKIMKPIPLCRAEFCEFIGFWINSNGLINRSLARSKVCSIQKYEINGKGPIT